MTREVETPAVPPLDDEIEWAGLRFFLPRDWQIVEHSVDTRAGSLRIIDRRRQRLLVSWMSCPSRPDLERLSSDHQSKLAAQGEASEFQAFRHGPFSGFSHQGRPGERITRAVRFHTPHSRLIEALFVDPVASSDSGARERWLDRFESTASPGEVRRWRAFDLDVTVPPGLRLEGADVKPAQATFTMASEHGAQEATIRRMGMARHWLAGELGALVRKQWPKTTFRRERRGEHGVELEGDDGSAPFARWFGYRRLQRTRVWLSRSEDAVYEVTTKSSQKAPLLPSELRVNGGWEEAACP